jgi:hypothetical protein
VTYAERRRKRLTASPTPAAAPMRSAKAFVVTHVRQALQQVVTIGACSPYFPAACTMRPLQTCFISSV